MASYRKDIMLRNLYIFAFAIVPIIDTLNGFLIKNGTTGSVTVGSIYRLILILFICGIWIKYISKRNFIMIAATIGYFIFACIMQFLLKINNNSIINEILNIVQWSFIFILFYSYEDLHENGEIEGKDIDIIFNIWSIITPLTIIVPYIFGIGYHTYYDTGYKGFYYATNAITYLLIILYLYSFNQLLKKVKLFVLIKNAAIIFSLGMIGTKSAYASLIVIPMICFIIKMLDVMPKLKEKDKIAIDKGRVVKIIGTISAVLAALVGVVYLFIRVYSEEVIKIFGRHKYFLNKSSSILSFVTTGRSDRIATYDSHIRESGNYIFRIIFGSGYGIEKELGPIEMDYFDAFYIFGAIGCLIILSFTWYVLKKRKGQDNKLFIGAYITTIVYSLLGGHVWNNALSTTCFAMICCMLISRETIDKEKKSNFINIDLKVNEDKSSDDSSDLSDIIGDY